MRLDLAKLGELEAAKEALRRAFALDEGVRLEAVKDDLCCLVN